MNDIEKVIDIAQGEVGYLEKKSNKELDSKTANAGSGNYTKYARDLDNLGDFYNGKKNGFAWCDVFFDWCIFKAFGKDKALELLCQPKKSTGAGCGFSMTFYKKKNQFYLTPKAGDQIFFKQGSSISHTGLVYKVDKTRVYTIEGNTSSAAGIVANGGCVAKKSYPLGASYIAGYGRPKYSNVQSSKTSGYNGTYPILPSRGYFYYDYKNKKIVDKGVQVQHLQKLLNWATNAKLDVDGYLGVKTREAILKYQKAYGLVQDACFGKACLSNAKTIKK